MARKKNIRWDDDDFYGEESFKPQKEDRKRYDKKKRKIRNARRNKQKAKNDWFESS